MTYFDILEKLGIEVLDNRRTDKFCTNIYNIIPAYGGKFIPFEEVFEVCQQIGITFDTLDISPNYPITVSTFLKEILYPCDSWGNRSSGNFGEYLGKISIILQTLFFVDDGTLRAVVQKMLNDCNLPYEICENTIIPKGVGEFDEALVCDVAQWLQQYPKAHKPYTTALQQYYNNHEPRDIADNLRKSLEDFLREFLGNKKNLENNIGQVGTFLKENNVNEEIREMFTTLISHYKRLNDKTAKHHDETNENCVEFLLYQTGVFIRFLLVIRQGMTP
jgi:hypothetical protein